MPKVFISYRHEIDAQHPDHQQRVRELGEKLRRAGCDVILDQFYMDANPGGPDEQWPKWCEDQVSIADKVVMVASDGYFRCYDQKEQLGVGLGAACETTVIRNVLYACGYKSNKFRIVYFDKNHLSQLPIVVRGVHQFDATASAEIAALIAWLGAPAPNNATITTEELIWPQLLTTHRPDLANRGDEFTFFTRMLSGMTAEQALLLEAPSNFGKTSLVTECIKYATETLKTGVFITVDFKGNPSKEFALDTLRIELAGLLPKFCQTNSAPIDLRTDLRALKTPVILLFDTYEKASIDAQEFVEGLLLGDLKKLPAVRIVIAGQKVPDKTKSIWAAQARHFLLGPITNHAHWCDYASRHFQNLTPEIIRALIIVADGNPGVLRIMLQSVAASLTNN